eukprot:2966038-Rhodomonas_salina.1
MKISLSLQGTLALPTKPVSHHPTPQLRNHDRRAEPKPKSCLIPQPANPPRQTFLLPQPEFHAIYMTFTKSLPSPAKPLPSPIQPPPSRPIHMSGPHFMLMSGPPLLVLMSGSQSWRLVVCRVPRPLYHHPRPPL